ncbi:MAG: DUF5987 family protein [Actinomycetota bacterium]
MDLTRRELIRRATLAFVAFQAAPALKLARAADPTGTFPSPDPASAALAVPSWEAFADTLIPGAKRPLPGGDPAIAGAAEGPGAVQAGAVDLLYFPATGVEPILGPCVAELNMRAAGYDNTALTRQPGVAPFVALSFQQRTELVLQMFDGPDGALWEALGAVVFLAYHTAGHLNTATAVQTGHPGLAAIGFPAPLLGDLWWFQNHSYARELASLHPGTTVNGSPA